MKRNKLAAVLAVLVFTLALSACSKEAAPAETIAATVATVAPAAVETTEHAEPLTLTDWSMGASTWSSPNGATIHITATPNDYKEGQTADFVVRLEDDDISSIPCQWDGTSYTASADLNAANGYCYYMVLTTADGTVTEVAVNTPAEPTNETFVNMEAALESYCSVTIDDSVFENGKLTLSSGTVQVKAPQITNEGESIICREATLNLAFNGEDLGQKVLPLSETGTAGLFEAPVENVVFDLPELEDQQSVELTVNATLSNGQILTAFGSSWVLNEEGFLPVVG